MQQVERHKHIFQCRQRRTLANIVFAEPLQRRRSHLHQPVQFINRIRPESHRCATLLDDPAGRAS